MSFWINESFTENNLCEVVRGIAGDLVEEVCFFLSSFFNPEILYSFFFIVDALISSLNITIC